MDIRVPVGLMFALFGALLTIYGIVTAGSDIYARHSLGVNVNLWSGLGMVVFGGTFLLLARRGPATIRRAAQSAEGRRIERLEKVTGREN